MSQVILINKGGHTYQMNVVHVLPNSIQNVRYGYGVIGLSTTVVKSPQIIDQGLEDVSPRDWTLRSVVLRVTVNARVVVA